jgi:hypothetical protein
MINKRHKMSEIIAGQLELNNMHHIQALCKLGLIMRAHDNQSECFSRLKLAMTELGIMHENSFNLPSGPWSGLNMDEKYKTLRRRWLRKVISRRAGGAGGDHSHARHDKLMAAQFAVQRWK